MSDSLQPDGTMCNPDDHEPGRYCGAGCPDIGGPRDRSSAFSPRWSCPECGTTRPPETGRVGVRCLDCGWRDDETKEGVD